MPWLTKFLTGLLSSIIRPILQEEIAKLKGYLYEQNGRLQTYKKYDEEALELIEAANNATTTEEVRAHLRRLKETRARLGV